MGKSKKSYYFVLCKDYSYCVPKRDLKTAEPNSIKVDDEVQFKYNNLSLTGRVKFMSASESEVLNEIKKEKVSRTLKQEDSFHEDKPRKSALKQREMMSAFNKNPAKTSDHQEVPGDSKTSKKAVKKLKDERKATAALLMESDMLDQVAETVSHGKADDTPLGDTVSIEGDDAGAGSNTSSSDAHSSNSSVDVHPQVRKAEQSKDLKELRELEAAVGASDNDSNETLAEEKALTSANDKGTTTATEDPQSVPAPSRPELSSRSPSPLQMNSDGDRSRSTSRESASRQSRKRDHSNSPDSREGKRRKSRSTSRDSSNSKSSRSSSNSSTSSDSSSSSSSSEEESKKSRHKKSRKSKKKKSGKKRSKKDSSQDSESDSDSKHRKKRKKSKKSSKKNDSTDRESDSDAKDSKKRKKTSKKSSDRNNSDSDSESDAKDRKKKKKSKKRRRHAEPVKRNQDVFPGKMYNYSEDSEDVVRVHKDHAVFLPKAELEKIIKESDTMAKLVKALCKCIFTREALQGSTAQGFPNRIVGKKRLRQRDVKPRLDPVGREAILAACADIQETKKSWRPRTEKKQMSACFTQSVKKLGDGK